MRNRLIGLIVALTAMFGLAACSGDEGGAGDATGGNDMSNAVILDVRDQAEWDAGHLQGAQLLPWNSGEFASQFSRLDKDAEYLIYCRSGNRAGRAKAMMEDNGFSNVTNLGSLEQAAETTGLEIVK